MRQSFSYILLITWMIFFVSCKTNFVQTGYETKNITVSSEGTPIDSSLVKLYLPYKTILEKDMNRVISYSEREMIKDKPESYLTNFLGDLLLDESAKVAQKNGLDIVPAVSFFNYGGIRTFLPKGEITVGKIFELMPFENELVFVELKGDKMQEFLDYIAAKGGDSVGGVRFKISGNKATNIFIGGKTLDKNKTYWLATNDYVAGGGDGLDVLKQRVNFVNTGERIRDIIIAYMESKQENKENLTAKLDGRITE